MNTPTVACAPPSEVECECGGVATKVWKPVRFICRGDPDDVGDKNLMVDTGGMSTSRAAAGGLSQSQAAHKEKSYRDYIAQRRRVFRDNKQVGGRLTHQVPVELYHAKIKQTGDKDYWKDSNNLNRHKSCQVS